MLALKHIVNEVTITRDANDDKNKTTVPALSVRHSPGIPPTVTSMTGHTMASSKGRENRGKVFLSSTIKLYGLAE